MKQEILDKMIESAKSRKDGIYALRGYRYVVSDNRVTLIGSRIDGQICQFSYGFLVNIVKVPPHRLTPNLKTLASQ